jgi:IS605 OrfB family transposase
MLLMVAMHRTIKLTLPSVDSLVRTIELYNIVCNEVLKVAFQARTFSKNKVHKLTYYGVRQKYPMLQSSMVQCLRDQACDMLKREKLKSLPKKKPYSAIRYNQRTFKPYLKKGVVSLSTIEGRIRVAVSIPKYHEQYLDWQVKNAMLSYDIHIQKLRLYIVVERETPKKIEATAVLGVDSGILNHAVLSNNVFFASNHIRNVKGRYLYLRQKLQAKGTRSAKRLLRKRSGRERRFMLDVNHRIAKLVVSQPFSVIALEKLEVKKTKRNGKCFNRKLGNWAWRQLQTYIEYKAEALGKTVVYVNPAYTSKTCSRCGQRGTRKGSVFKCKHCGFELNADLNASRNIAHKGMSLLGRLLVNEPNAPLQSIATKTEATCKPTNLLVGS